MTEPEGLPRPVVSPDGTRYWDGSDWRLLPGPNSEWNGAQWLAKPDGIESMWTGKAWAVRPTLEAQWSGTEWVEPPVGVEARWDGKTWRVKDDADSMWSGTQWVSPPPDGRSAWNGRSWVRAPNEDAVWNGSIWVAPSVAHDERVEARSGRAKLLLVLGVLVLLVSAVVGLTVGIRGYQSFETATSPSASAAEPLTVQEQALLDRWDASGTDFAFRNVPSRDQIDFLLASCKYLEDAELGRTDLLDWMGETERTWSREYGLQIPSPSWAKFASWLEVGMNYWCNPEATRFTTVMDNGSPGRLESVTATPVGKGKLELSWVDAVGQEYVTVPVVYQYRVDGGEWMNARSRWANVEGLKRGSRVYIEVRVVWGNPAAGGAFGAPFRQWVRVQ